MIMDESFTRDTGQISNRIYGLAKELRGGNYFGVSFPYFCLVILLQSHTAPIYRPFCMSFVIINHKKK